VPSHDPALDAPIQSHDDLVRVFLDAHKDPSEFRIGAEMEKPGVERVTARSLPYEGGEKNVLRVLRTLVDEHGWHEERESAKGPLIALSRNGASVTLEPGGQLELSGAPLTDIHQVCREFRAHLKEIEPVSRAMGVQWLGVGLHPFARREDLPWVPKGRYAIMREYLPTRGAHALDMMLRTSTVQANYDYIDEADAMKKMRVALKLAPLTTAMLANSPWLEGKAHGGVSYRAEVWLDVDPDRSGLVEPLWREGAGYADYVEWALGVPMFMFKRGETIFPNTGQTFRSFWKDGFQGQRPTQNDWQTHLNTLFPEVRLKKTIEIRGADAQSARLACALPALWTGVLYDGATLDRADAMTRDWTHAEVSAIRPALAKHGLRAKFRGKPLADYALELLALSEAGLERRGCKNANGKDERVHLVPLRELAERAMCPADKLLEGLDPSKELRAQILERTDLAPPT